MSISILFPLFYLVAGFGLGQVPFDIKGRASALLTKIVIPTVIIFNIATHKSGVFAIMLGIIAMMSLMILISRLVTRDPVQMLCYCYLNIGWLGLPIATTLFGDEAAMVIVAAYVGSSLFGNSVGVGLMIHGQDWKTRLRQTLKAPPVWALLIGLAGIPFGAQIEHYARPAYDVLKFLMGFLGMAILGIWLSASSVKAADFKQALRPFLARLISIAVLISVFIAICQYFGVGLVTRNVPVLYLISLLPPAANIIVLETHYMKSGRSATTIACGTCFSIVAIALYVVGIVWAHH